MPYDKKNYASNFDTRKLILKDLLNWTCQQCGRKRGELRKRRGRSGVCTVQIHAHHPDRDTANPEARLMVLCDLCHLQSKDDAPERAKSAWRARRHKERQAMIEAGQLELGK